MMLEALFTLFILTQQIEGGWESISVQSKEVNSVRKYLQDNIQILFPEIENSDFIIESAQVQIVAGMNLQLHIKTIKPQISFIITLYVDLQRNITIIDIEKDKNTRPMLGQYIWHDVSPIINQTLQNLVQGNIIVYRTKIERGMKTHIIFRDPEEKVYSAIFAINPKTKNEELIFIYEII